MDKGAHFYKCDFQVHSPRDANWDGRGAVSSTERQTYAEELVQACRAKGINAIAITDHHDLAFFPYIKAASKAEVDATGNQIPNEQQLIVFPGIELTLSSPPCQVILLLDADFDESKFGDILTTLAIQPTEPNLGKVGKIDPISPTAVTDLNHLQKLLSQHPWLRGRFIILPNVTDQGHKDLLREGFHQHYKEMHCVGGYVDGDYARIRDGRKAILEGRQQNNGYKPIAVFQTSDNRRRDHANLGSHVTYVKWSEPTAEALRQACLARESRLSLTEPQLPTAWITALTVSNSKFLGHFTLDFNQQYNAIIGGRGTGKSTILEYLRWGLCDQAIESDDIDIVQRKRKSLIDNTLQKFDGEVAVEFVLNGVLHVVKRSAKTQELTLRIGQGPFTATTEHQIRTLLPIQAYSQKQLSSVGVRVDELRRFVELPVKQELDQIRSELRDTAARMRTAYGNLVRGRELAAEYAKNNVEINSASEQLERLRKDLKGLSSEDEKTISAKAKYDSEEAIIEALRNRLENAKEEVQELIDALATAPADTVDEAEIVNKSVLKTIQDNFASRFAEIESGAQALSKLFEKSSLQEIDRAIKEWEVLKAAFERKYEAAKAQAKVNQQQLDQIQMLERRIAALKKQQTEKKNAITALGKPEGEYKTLRGQWNNLHARKVGVLDTQCRLFTALSEGMIKAEIRDSLDAVGLAQKLKVAFAGMNIREDKIERICQLLMKSSDPFAEWNKILLELQSLVNHEADGPDELPDTPELNKCNFIDTERKRIAAHFDSSRWIELSVAELEFNPRFDYCTNKTRDEYIAFADASAGQQATALLTVLLNQPGAPLVIDQPEDDIDSKLTRQIVERVWKAKGRRQLIFASHSANFVVNGDAELVVCCDYTRSGDQTRGSIKMTGAIDKKDIKEEIILVTEGGRAAFKLRMDQYGF